MKLNGGNVSIFNNTDPEHENEYYVVYDNRFVLAEIFLDQRLALQEILRHQELFSKQIDFIKTRALL